MSDLRTVAVFDRHRLVAEVLASGLSARGVRATGIELTEAAAPPAWLSDGDVVLLDAHVGWPEVQRWLTLLALDSPGTRLALMTGASTPVSETTARRAGVWGWFARKATLSTAATVVRTVLDGHPMFATHGAVVELPRQRQPLTRREQQVLAEIAAGVSYAQIAERLQVSHNTVRTHATSIRTKLGVRNRSAAVAVAHGVRIVDDREGSRLR
jgi:two-component system response regulator DesR